MRHACDQGDGLEGYSWVEYDPRQGGVQIINDAPNNVKITTEFLKVPGGEFGGSWAARVKGEPLNPGRCSDVLGLCCHADTRSKHCHRAFRPFSTSVWRALAVLTWRRKKTKM